MTLPFLISIDTEGDNLWSRPRTITTKNADFLWRFQHLCENNGFKPTYLTNHEMALSPSFRTLATDRLRRGTCEVGMHLHAWNSPPLEPLTADDWKFHPYLIEFPTSVLRQKVKALTGLLEDTFQTKMVTHRAGRWAFDERYAQALVDEGYLVDTSVTPHVSWRSSKGDPWGRGGANYSSFPEEPYFVSPSDISKSGVSSLLEVPMTTAPRWPRLSAWAGGMVHRAFASQAGMVRWLRPRRGHRDDLLFLVERALREKRACVQMMLHSSELMPGGSPTFPDERSVEELYADLARFFEAIRGKCKGMTFSEFRQSFPASTMP